VQPKFALAWYQSLNGKLSIVDPQNVQHELSVDDVFKNRIRIPINLAIRNIDKVPLEVVRVELGYGRDMEVHSKGNAKIDPGGRRLIYEHSVGTLEKVDEFTPLQSIDIVEIPFHFIKDRFITLFGDDVPVQSALIVGQDIISKRELVLDLRVFCKDRPPVEGRIRINIKSGVQPFWDVAQAKQVDVHPGDEYFFSPELSTIRVINRWSATISPSNKIIDYELLETANAYVQRVAVNGILRRVGVDTAKTGTLTFVLVNSAGEQPPIRRLEFGDPWPLIDWPKKEVQ
jgi:hypothetical protein